MKRLTYDQVLRMHRRNIERTGGCDGIRDEGLLDAALEAPFQTFDSQPLWPNVESQAARLATGIIRNHPFLDGNKRTGILAMLVFLRINHADILVSDEELIELGLAVASGKMETEQVREWIVARRD